MFDNEDRMKQSLQQAYLPKNIPAFQDTLKQARLRRATRSVWMVRAAVAAVVVLGVVSLALSYQETKTAAVSPVPLQAIKIEPAQKPPEQPTTPTEEPPQPAGEKTTPKKADDIGYLVANTFPLIDLTLIVDRRTTPYKTPIGGDGIALTAGEHWIYFKESNGTLYGPYLITITKGATARESFALSKELTLDQKKQRIRDKILGFDEDTPKEEIFSAETEKSQAEIEEEKKKIREKLAGIEKKQASNKEPNPTQADIEARKKRIRDKLMGFDGEIAEDNTIESEPELKDNYGYVQIETKPKKALLVYINGKDSGFTTPVRDTGVRLLPGTYQIELKDDSLVSYGKFSVIVNAGSTQKQTFSVSKQTSSNSSPKIKDGQLTNPFKNY